MTLILDGKKLRDSRVESLKYVVDTREVKPTLVIIDIGGFPINAAYVRQKVLFGTRIGVNVVHKTYIHESTEDIVSYIHALNENDTVQGIIVQLPIVDGYDLDRIVESIAPEKDVDGLTSHNQKLLYEGGTPHFIPAPVRGVLEILETYNFSFKGQALIIGDSLLTGKPLGEMLRRRGMDVEIANRETDNIPQKARESDLLVSATGTAHLVGEGFVNETQWVVDVGFSYIEESGVKKIVGDVDFDQVKDCVAAITPVPGGVGPMAVLALFENLLRIKLAD